MRLFLLLPIFSDQFQINTKSIPDQFLPGRLGRTGCAGLSTGFSAG